MTLTGLAADQVYGVTISARNRAQVSSDADWARSSTVSARAVGEPSAPVAVRADRDRNTITVSWQAPADLGGATSATYSVWRQGTGTGATGCNAAGTRILNDQPSFSVTDSPPDDGTYTYVVVARNGYFCGASGSASSTSVTPPGAATGSVSVEQSDSFGNFDLRAGNLAAASGTADRYEYRVGGGAWRPVANGEFIASDAPSGRTLSVTFRACKTILLFSECGAESAPSSATPVSTRPAGAVCSVNQPLIVNDPLNGPDAAVAEDGNGMSIVFVTVAQGAGGPVETESRIDPATGRPWTRSSTVPETAASVRVTTTVDADGTSYTDPGSFTTSCS